MANRGARRSGFFLHMAWAFLAIAIIGFSTTFFFPLARGAFTAPPIIFIHGALLFSWLLFFILQAWLIRSRSVSLHRRIGWFGAVLCAAVVVSGVLVGLFATRRDLAADGGTFALGQFVNILLEMLLFGSLVAAAIALRRDGDSHKRLLLLATISVIGPAWLRFRHIFPSVEHPFIVFSLIADSVLLIAVARDLFVYKRVHPTYIWAGGTMVAVHMAELFASESPIWLHTARWLLGETAV